VAGLPEVVEVEEDGRVEEVEVVPEVALVPEQSERSASFLVKADKQIK
jgi:hypothetical protein